MGRARVVVSARADLCRDIVVDVGAHIGTFTVPFARKVGPRGAVVALEAQRLVFQNLCANLVANEVSNVRAFNLICGREPYYLGLIEVPLSRAPNTGAFWIEREPRQERKWNRTPAETLDGVLSGLPSLALLKVDVEGFEQDVLEGGRETIRRLSPVIHCECLTAESFEYLRAFGRSYEYRLFGASFESMSPDNFFGKPLPPDKAGLRDTNVLLWPAGRSLPGRLRMTEVATFAELRDAPVPASF